MIQSSYQKWARIIDKIDLFNVEYTNKPWLAYNHFRTINLTTSQSNIIIVNIRQSHWVFAHLDNKNSKITYYNSLHFKGSQILSKIEQILQLKRKSEILSTVTCELIDSKTSPRQSSFNDCEIYVIINARLIMKGITIDSASFKFEMLLKIDI